MTAAMIDSLLTATADEVIAQLIVTHEKEAERATDMQEKMRHQRFALEARVWQNNRRYLVTPAEFKRLHA